MYVHMQFILFQKDQKYGNILYYAYFGITILKKSEVSIAVRLHNQYIAQHYTVFMIISKIVQYTM